MCLYLDRTGSHESIFRSDRVTCVYGAVRKEKLSKVLVLFNATCLIKDIVNSNTKEKLS